MNHYLLSGQVQGYLTQSYHDTGVKQHFCDAVAYLHRRGYSTAVPKNGVDIAGAASKLNELLDSLVIPVSPALEEKPQDVIGEHNFFAAGQDVLVYRHFSHISNGLYKYECFEMAYVYRGSCVLLFENEKRTLRQGEFCVVAPGSLHDFVVDDDALVIRLMLRNSTFHSMFFNQMGEDNPLSAFLKAMLYGDVCPNYLLFQAERRDETNDIIRHLVIENCKFDSYSNACSLHYVQLLFASLMRNRSDNSRCECYQKNLHCSVDIPVVLRYIQQNFKTLTLHSLAEHFHYSESYPSRQIKKSTGSTFIEIVTGLKLKMAEEYLVNSDCTIIRIAEMLGYESVDHFSRLFKKRCGSAPYQYRKAHEKIVPRMRLVVSKTKATA